MARFIDDLAKCESGLIGKAEGSGILILVTVSEIQAAILISAGRVVSN